MSRMWQGTSAEVVAVVVKGIDDTTDPETFATELFEKWGIGKKDKDNGILVLVSTDDHAAVIRTGYGMEGVLPDIVAGKIIRNAMFPRFREGDFDGGLLAGLSQISNVVTDPEYADELRSRYQNDADTEDDEWMGFIWLGVSIGGIALVYILFIMTRYAKQPNQQWSHLQAIRLLLLICTIFFIGIPLPAFLLLVYRQKILKNKPPECPRCSTKMVKLPQSSDHRWLSSGQLAERRVKSVSHDVWECPECGYGAVHSFPNPYTSYIKCSQCNAMTKHLIADRTLRQPTLNANGIGERVYRCEHCGDEDHQKYNIARKVAPVIFPSGGGGFGGGFSGGSFGGGHTGGGGASGRW